MIPWLEMAEQSALAYADSTIEIGAVGFRVVPRNGYVLLGGRGTANFQDVIFDIKGTAVRRANEPGLMEMGFAQASDECLVQLPPLISDYKNSVPIYCGFHSFACPVGRRTVAHLVDLGYKIAGVLCLESPLTWDKAGEDWYASKKIPTMYVRHGADGVCTVPPRSFGYEFPGQEDETVIVGSGGSILSEQSFPPSWRFVEGCRDTLRDHAVAGVMRDFRLYLEHQNQGA